MRTKKTGTRPRKSDRSARRRENSSGVGGRLLIMAAVVVAVIFGVAIFFKVNRIEVQGNSLYSAQEIIDASQIQTGDNLLTLNKPEAAGRIQAALPYVESVSIGRSMPDTVIIDVKESSAAFAVATETNTVWLINGVGKALEQIANDAMADHQRNPRRGRHFLQSERTERGARGHRGAGRHRRSGACGLDQCGKGLRHRRLV